MNATPSQTFAKRNLCPGQWHENPRRCLRASVFAHSPGLRSICANIQANFWSGYQVARVEKAASRTIPTGFPTGCQMKGQEHPVWVAGRWSLGRDQRPVIEFPDSIF